MLVLLNSTKTMDPLAPHPAGLPLTTPAHLAAAAALVRPLQRLSKARLAERMGVSDKLAAETRAVLARWSDESTPRAPALFAFTGLVYKHIEPAAWSAEQINDAQDRLVLLSGLYGLLRPLDLVAAYRLEMGSRIKPPRSASLVAFWSRTLTTAVNERLEPGEPILNLAAQEYAKVLDAGSLKGPLISPVFRETRGDGSLRNPSVHAKMARGAMVRHIFTAGAMTPADLLGFGAHGWEAAVEPPPEGPWLFTRPARD